MLIHCDPTRAQRESCSELPAQVFSITVADPQTIIVVRKYNFATIGICKQGEFEEKFLPLQ